MNSQNRSGTGSNRRRRRTRPNIVKTQKNFVTPRELRNRLRGTIFKVRPDPPRIRLTPWKQQIITLTGTGVTAVTDSTIAEAINAQNHISTLAAGYNYVFRIIDARIWIEISFDATTKFPIPLSNPLTVTFHSLIGEGDFSQQSDYSGDISYASIGYRWSATDQQVTLTSTSADRILSIKPTSTTAQWLAYISVLWSTELTSDEVELPILDGHMANLGITCLKPND